MARRPERDRNVFLPVLITLVAATAVAAQDNHGKFPTAADVFAPSTFAARRARLAPLVGDGIVVLFGEKNLIDAWDEHANDPFFKAGPFRQEENLFYLTGLDVPDVALVFDPRAQETRVYGPLASSGDELARAVERLGLGAAHPMSALEADIDRLVAGGSGANKPTIYILTHNAAGASSFNPQHRFAPFLPGAAAGTFREDAVAARVQQRFPMAAVKSAVPALVSIRKVLDADEIAAMRRVVSVSADALKQGIAAVAPGRDEREIAAEIEYSFKKAGAQMPAYGADIQSGPNGLRSFIDLFRSYDSRNRTMQAGEVALVDHSAELNYYVSDLARTVPVSGHFSADQRIAYVAYQKAWEAGLGAIKPGMPYRDAARASARAMEQQLASLPAWLRDPAAAFAKALAAGTPGHFLGMNLQMHTDYDSPLVAGQVVAYESALQIPDRGWRFTLEDVILVTPDGHENLSASLPRSPDDLEALMRKSNRGAR